MTIEWMAGTIIGLLVMIAGFLMSRTLNKLDEKVDKIEEDVSDLKEKSGSFVSFSKCAEHNKETDRKISDIYTHQSKQYELLRQDIKSLGKEIKEDVNRHADDHLKAYHSEK